MGELLYQILVEITNDRLGELMISKIDLDHPYGQMRLSEETSRQCVFAITDIPTILIFPEKVDRTLEYCTPALLDDLIVETRGTKKEHKKKQFDVLRKLKKGGYRASQKKSLFFQIKLKWLRHEIDANGIKPKTKKS